MVRQGKKGPFPISFTGIGRGRRRAKTTIDTGSFLKTIVHVNQHKIKRNAKHGECEPVLTCKTYKSNDYAHEVVIHGPCKVVYRPSKPLACGARVWIETESKIERVLNPQGGFLARARLTPLVNLGRDHPAVVLVYDVYIAF